LGEVKRRLKVWEGLEEKLDDVKEGGYNINLIKILEKLNFYSIKD
jgi:hypothetical protein